MESERWIGDVRIKIPTEAMEQEIAAHTRRAVAAEHDRLRMMLIAHLEKTAMSHHVTLAECHAARNALQLVIDEWPTWSNCEECAEAWREHMRQRDAARLACWCEHCDIAAHNGMRTRMSVCPDCGDKRCPRAAQHGNECCKPPNVMVSGPSDSEVRST